MSTELLSHEETLELISAAQNGDEQALDMVVRSNIALVHSVAQKYKCSMDYDDLFQIGSIGLVKAVRNYDRSFNVRFSTYAVPLIAGEIKRTLRDEGQVKVSRSVKELAYKAALVQEELQSEYGRDVSIEEIAKKLGCSPYDVAESLEAVRPCVSINEPVFYDGSEVNLEDRLSSGEDTQEKVLKDILLQDALARLDERDRRLIDMRYFRNMTQRQIALVLGISQVQVSRLETKALGKLRGYLADSG